jgi:hypothetical protein
MEINELTSSRSRYFLLSFLYFSTISCVSFGFDGCAGEDKGAGTGGGPITTSLSGATNVESERVLFIGFGEIRGGAGTSER